MPAVAAGSACSTGVCSGTTGTEKCVPCADNAAGTSQDAGCTSTKPLCDASGPTPTCYECLSNSDCAPDSVSCTVETCTNHVCSHVATDSLCPASADVCKRNKCDIAAVGGCKQVDISSQSPLITTDLDAANNGGFESPGSDPKTAAGWLESGAYYVIYNCSGSGCSGGNGLPFRNPPASVGGTFIAWTGQ
ncbi:MAG: hypothetical protein WDO74_03735 [Pseudomonadota bacterium]